MPLIRKEPSAPAPAKDTPHEALTRGTPEERWEAARALGGDPTAVAPLALALVTEDQPRVREAILTGLARTASAEAVDAVLPHLRSDDAGLRTGVLDALKAMPSAVAARLEALLRDPDSDVRILACDLARHVPAAQAAPLLARVLQVEPEVNVCAAAVETLAELGGPDEAPALLACANRFPEAPFLRFSIEVTLDRIAAQAPPQRG